MDITLLIVCWNEKCKSPYRAASTSCFSPCGTFQRVDTTVVSVIDILSQLSLCYNQMLLLDERAIEMSSCLCESYWIKSSECY